MTERIVLDLDAELKKTIKVYAAQNRMTVKQVLLKALGLMIKEVNKKTSLTNKSKKVK